MDIAALKEQAHTLEEQGDAAGALATYRKILDEIEGTRKMLSELPLYVKAGDLLLKLRHAKDAVAMYDRAARLYAQHGSTKNVLALCSRILVISPQATSVYPRYASLMIRTEHVVEACAILQRYAEKAELPKVAEALQPFADRKDDDAKRVLEMLIHVVEENERLKRGIGAQALRLAEQTPSPASPGPADAPQDAVAEPVPADPSSPPATPLEVSPTHEEPGALSAGESEPLVVHGFDPVPPDEAQVETSDEAVYDSPAPGAAEVPASFEPRYKEYAPDSWSPQDAEPPSDGKHRPKLLLALAIIIVVGAAAGLVYLGVIP